MNERLVYTGSCLLVSTAVTLFFYLLALEKGYSKADIMIGSIWTFVLATIISSPVIIPIIRKYTSNR